MKIFEKYSKAFLLLLVAAFTMVVTSCSDDDNEGWDTTYGYVQFKLIKKASSSESRAAATDKLEKLDDAKKIKVVMEHNGTTVSQTLVLNSYNAENAEYGLRSDKLQLTSGTYTVIGFYLYDAVDEELLASSADNTFNVIGGGMAVEELTVSAVERGKVKFNLVKEWQKSRAGEGEYLFSNIRLIDVNVTNLFTRETFTFPNMKVKYKEMSEEHQNPDNANDKYMQIGTAYCDTTVWLPAGTYQVTSYTTYGKTGAVKTKYETQPVNGKSFVVKDNKITDDAQVPVLLSKTKEYIKDYEALKAIWESLNGKDWSFYGDATFKGANWNFNKELDMWGEQPGVTLNSNGRVIGLIIAGFGAKGIVPDAIGQLTELQVFNLGSHDEKIGANIFNEYNATNLDAAKKNAMRHDYENKFLKYDPRAFMSEMIVESFNSDPKVEAKNRIKKDGRINLKDAQIGTLTNRITGVSKAIYRLTKLQQFYIGNSSITSDEVCAKFYNADDATYGKFAEEFTEEAWDNMTNLTDIELYNCPKISRLPDFYYNLPALQAMNLARCKGISAEQLRKDWTRLAEEKTGKTVQILYLSYNNLEEFPESSALSKMVNLGLLDLAYNNIKKLHPFGTGVSLSSLYLNNNQIEEIPANLCAFTDDVESLTFAHNKLTKIPNIFDASSVRQMGSVDFSYNEITGVDNSNGTYKGINAASISLSNNKIEKFPSELFTAGSPITTLDLSANQMRTIPKGSIKGKNAHLLQIIDFRFNKLTSLSDDFRSTTLPYITNMDLSYNCFTEVPVEPLNSAVLRAFAINHQRDDVTDQRCLRTWPTGITTCPSLIQFQIGSNDIRKVEETLTSHLYIVNIADNPNISIDVTSVCPYIKAGMYMLFYDKTQDIRGCDALDLEN